MFNHKPSAASGAPARARRQPGRGAALGGIVVGVVGIWAATAANADTLAAINQARVHECRGGPPALVRTRELDAGAARLAGGASLHAVLAMLPLRPASATAIHLLGASDERTITRLLASRYCADLAAPELREVGFAWSGLQLHILAAARLPVTTARERANAEHEVLRLVNAARAAARRCGRTAYPAAPPLAPSALLTRVASEHSAAMAARDDLQHQDPDGSTPADRVRRAGYAARVVGENVASGVTTAAAAVAGWLESPGHCANIMDARFREMGVAYALARQSSAAIYWTQLLATPRS